MAEASNDLPGEGRRWAPSRIASAAVLALLVLGGVAYGIYSLVSSSSPTANNSPKSSQLTAPNSKAKTSPKSSAGSSSPLSSANGTPKSSSTSPAASATGSNGQLSNTGPGNTVLIGFVVATALGSLAHYGWRRYHSAA